MLELCSGGRGLSGAEPRLSCRASTQSAFTLPALPYSVDALAPYISRETLEHHHGKHHATYVANLNKLTEGTALASRSLEELIMTQGQGAILNNAAQAWNHNFYWHSMSPGAGGEPTGPLRSKIIADFGSVSRFRGKFNEVAMSHFGSGWAWLVQNQAGKLEVLGSHDAGTPLRDGLKPLLVADLWEHAYYIDYRNARAQYIDAWWHLVNWKFAAANLGVA